MLLSPHHTFIGVYRHPDGWRWCAVGPHRDKGRAILGTYQTAEAAARAYDCAMRYQFGALAKVNFEDAPHAEGRL